MRILLDAARNTEVLQPYSREVLGFAGTVSSQRKTILIFVIIINYVIYVSQNTQRVLARGDRV